MCGGVWSPGEPVRFVDEIEFVVASGNGGDGCVSFRRERFVPRGGPDGGDGGRGGDLVFEASSQRNTLVDYRRNKIYRARNGHAGMGRNRTGAAGDDLVLLVPIGTVITDAETGEQLADLTEDGAVHAVRGGRGGLGNTHFASGRVRTPMTAQEGQEGTELRVHLELRLIADVGLLGYPNAGKSTLIGRITAARPKVAAYPFTTLVPSLGVVQLEPGVSYVVADIPGLVDGAADGVGLGHQFLRHLERCACFLHLVAPDDWERPVTERVEALNRELRAFNPALAERPQILVLTKADVVDNDERARLRAELEALRLGPVLEISAVRGDGVRRLVGTTWQMIHAQRASEDPS